MLEVLRRLLSGEIERSEAEVTLAEAVFAAGDRAWATYHDHSEALAFELSTLVCGPAHEDAELLDVIRTVLECVGQVPQAGAVLVVLPLLEAGPNFCALVARYSEGVISRTGILSLIAKRFSGTECRAWLDRASAHQLNELCALLQDQDYKKVYFLVAAT